MDLYYLSIFKGIFKISFLFLSNFCIVGVHSALPLENYLKNMLFQNVFLLFIVP